MLLAEHDENGNHATRADVPEQQDYEGVTGTKRTEAAPIGTSARDGIAFHDPPRPRTTADRNASQRAVRVPTRRLSHEPHRLRA